MKNYFKIIVLLFVIFKCDGHKPRVSILDGLWSGVQGIGSKVQDVIGGFTRPGHNGNRPWQQKPPGGGGYTEPETETIVVVIEEEQPNEQQPVGQQQYGQTSYNHNSGYNRPNSQNRPQHGYNSHHYGNYQSSGGHYHHHHNKPGYAYGYGHQGVNYDGNYNYGNNNGNYGIPSNNQMAHGHYGNNKPQNHQGYNYGNQFSNENATNNNGDYGNLNPNGNQQKPINDFTTKAPDSSSTYGSVFDPNKEIGAHNNPNSYNQNNQEIPTTKPNNDKPLLIPLNPNQYTYGGDKIDINAPKRETEENKKPLENTDEEDAPIDIRFGEKY